MVHHAGRKQQADFKDSADKRRNLRTVLCKLSFALCNARLTTDEKIAILNAYYLPGIDPRRLSPSITPVNTFRLFSNEYFGGQFEMLEDKSYFEGQPAQLPCSAQK